MSENAERRPLLTETQREELREVLKKKQTEKAKKEFKSWQKILRVSTFLSLSVNLLLLADLYLFPPVIQHDTIVKTEDLYIRADQYNRKMIYTAEGKFWMVEYSKYDFTSNQIVYLKTPFFSISSDIFNHQTGYMIIRYFNARIDSNSRGLTCIAMAILAIGLTRANKRKIADHLTTVMLLILGAELVILLI
ncbi:MAG: hypothetical protein IPG07_21215 [Crocinitomicaceae bacterium]|nr:hypothetical protein [Crocinitomicaceae bacterium]